uniref:CAP N-terminal domain-containing protein n=1 Tax=Rhodosorus marinus TaxID=101924 RepID=A0A7S3EAM7_9RHOD
MSKLALDGIMSGPLASYVAACKDLGGLVEKQAGFVSDAFKEEMAFLNKASSMEKPGDDEFQAMLGVIGGEMGKVASVTSEAAPRSPLENHLTAVSESIGALGWVAVDSKPVPYIGDMEQAGEFYLSKILMQYKKTEEYGKHERFVKSVREIYTSVKAYVKEYHTTSLQWNTASRKTVKGPASTVVEEESSGTDPLSSFEAVLSGSVEEFSGAAKDLGGLVEEQSTFFVVALKEEFKLLQNASKMAKPGSDAFQSMLAPIAENMGKVGEITSQAPPRDPFQNHLNALSESVGALGWVAVDSTPVSFIADMEAAGEFYISKLLMEYKKKDDFAKHEAFSKSLKAVYADLKKYVKEHHTTGLSWNWASSS